MCYRRCAKPFLTFNWISNGTIERGDQNPLPFLLAELRKHTVLSASKAPPAFDLAVYGMCIISPSGFASSQGLVLTKP